MALVRVSALKDFRSVSLATADVSTGFNLGGVAQNQKIYAGLHLTSASLGTTARVLGMTVQVASSSGFSVKTTVASFLLSTVQGGEWAVPVAYNAAGPTTDQVWARANWTLSTVASTGGTWKGLVWMGFK